MLSFRFTDGFQCKTGELLWRNTFRKKEVEIGFKKAFYQNGHLQLKLHEYQHPSKSNTRLQPRLYIPTVG